MNTKLTGNDLYMIEHEDYGKYYSKGENSDDLYKYLCEYTAESEGDNKIADGVIKVIGVCK